MHKLREIGSGEVHLVYVYNRFALFTEKEDSGSSQLSEDVKGTSFGSFVQL